MLTMFSDAACTKEVSSSLIGHECLLGGNGVEGTYSSQKCAASVPAGFMDMTCLLPSQMSMMEKIEDEKPACASQCGEPEPTTCTEMKVLSAGGCLSSCSADVQALLQIMAFGCGCMPTPAPTNAMTTPASTPSPTNAMTTPAPTQPPTHFVGPSVSVGFKFKNVDFTKMTETHKDSMKKGITADIVEHIGVPADNVVVFLSAGSAGRRLSWLSGRSLGAHQIASVAVNVQIKPTAAMDAAALNTKVDGNKNLMAQRLVTAVAKIELGAAKTGEVSITSFTSMAIVPDPTPAPTDADVDKARAGSCIAGAISTALALSYSIE